ncbi:MAG: hypothetical protein AAGA18_15475 [Verrucomicrobiota bacterium]
MNNVVLSPKERDDVLTLLSDLPSWDVLKQCTTEGQQEWVLKIRQHYRELGHSLNQYFTGQAHRFSEDLPEPLKEDLLNQRDRWLQFYKVIQLEWNDIHQRLIAVLKPDIVEQFGELFATPGVALLLCIHQESVLACAPVFEAYFRWTPSEGRKTDKLLRKREELLNTRKLTKAQRLQLNNADKYLNPKQDWNMQYYWLYPLCLGAAQDIQKKNRRLKTYMRELGIIEGKQWLLVNKYVSSQRHGIQGFEWKNGVSSPMSKHGGVSEKAA